MVFKSIIGAICFAVTSFNVNAIPIGGVEFSDGAQSFADAVFSYNPGSGVSSDYDDPTQALGTPDYPTGVTADGNGHVSLGAAGGELILQFTDNYLTISGDSGLDLWIFEVGPAVEPTYIDISIDSANWISVGSVGGSTSGVDIDAYVGSGEYSFVRLTTKTSYSGYPYGGPDIDAVGAISTIIRDVPEPTTLALMGLGLAGLGFVRRHKT